MVNSRFFFRNDREGIATGGLDRRKYGFTDRLRISDREAGSVSPTKKADSFFKESAKPVFVRGTFTGQARGR